MSPRLGATGGDLVVFDPATGKIQGEIPRSRGRSPPCLRTGSAWRLSSSVKASPPTYGPIRVHDLETGSITTMQGLCVWVLDEENPQCRKAPKTPFQQWVWSLDFSPDGALLAAGGSSPAASASGTRPQVSWCSTVASPSPRCRRMPSARTEHPGRGERDRDRRVRRGHLERGGASALEGAWLRNIVFTPTGGTSLEPVMRRRTSSSSTRRPGSNRQS